VRVNSRLPGTDNSVIPTCDSLLSDIHRHAFGAKAMIDLPAWAARLGNLENNAADLKNIANMDVAFTEMERGDIFSQAARDQGLRAMCKFLREPCVVFDRVVVKGFLHSAVNSGIAVLVSHNALHFHAGLAEDPFLEDTAKLSFRF
jgi:hypothetical protein